MFLFHFISFELHAYSIGIDQLEVYKLQLHILRQHNASQPSSKRIHNIKPMCRIRDVYSGSRIRIFPSLIQGLKDLGSAPGSGSASKKYSFNQKICFWALGNMIRDVHLGSRIRIFSPIPDPDPGVKKVPDPESGSATLQERRQNLTRIFQKRGLAGLIWKRVE